MKFRIFPAEQGLMPWIWLTFLGFPLIGLFPYDSLDKKFALGLLLVFAIAYRNAYFSEKKVVVWILVQQAIALFYCFLYSYIALLIFPGYFIGYMLQEKQQFWRMTFFHWSLVVVGSCYTFFSNVPGYFNLYYGTMNLIFGVMTLLNPFVGRRFVREYYQRMQDMQIKKRSESLVKQEERQRIARDLHDTLGQSLSIMTLKSELARKLIEKAQTGEAMAEIHEVSLLSRETLKVVREIVTTMRSVLVVEELFQMTQTLDGQGMYLFIEGEELSSQLAPELQNVLSACLHECTTNLIRHSHATRVWVRFWQTQQTFFMEVSDDGRLKKAVVVGNGLKGLEERAVECGGQVTFETAERFVTRFAFPLETSAAEEEDA